MSFGIYRPKPTIYFISKEIQGHDLAISATLNSNIVTIQAFATELSQKTNKQNKTDGSAKHNITTKQGRNQGERRGGDRGGLRPPSQVNPPWAFKWNDTLYRGLWGYQTEAQLAAPLWKIRPL